VLELEIAARPADSVAPVLWRGGRLARACLDDWHRGDPPRQVALASSSAGSGCRPIEVLGAPDRVKSPGRVLVEDSLRLDLDAIGTDEATDLEQRVGWPGLGEGAAVDT
jgi:hypothetical protein